LRIATNAKEEVTRSHRFLADWERQHLDALQRFYTSVREDFLAAGSFASL
jgi:predicted ATPase